MLQQEAQPGGLLATRSPKFSKVVLQQHVRRLNLRSLIDNNSWNLMDIGMCYMYLK